MTAWTRSYCDECRRMQSHKDGKCLICYPERERPEPRDPETVDLFDRPEAA